MGILKSIISNSRIAPTIVLGFVFSALFSLHPGSSQASDPVVFQSFDFGVLRGQVAHEAFVPISGEPVSGVSQSVVGTLTGPFNTAQFRLVSLTGGILQTLNLEPPFAGGSPSGFGEFTGSFIPPDQPFQVGVSGLDTSGNSYDIIIEKIFTPQPLEVVFDRTTLDKSGNTSTLFIDVTNHGNSGTFLVNASDIAIKFSTEVPRGELSSFITRVSPSSLSLSSGKTAGIEIDITPPSGAPIDTGVILTVEVAKSGDPGIFNRDVLTFPVLVDTTPPTVNPPSNVTVDSTGSLTPVTIGQATATDNVGVFSLSSNSDGLFPVGTTEVTWVALDAAGNLGTATQFVTVTGSGNNSPGDTVPPNITPPPDVTVQATGGQTTIDIGTAAATDDVSSSANIAITNNAPATFPVGVTSVIWTATDEAGNSATATQIVTVTENGSNENTVLDIRVSAGSDDAEERASGAMSLNSSDLELTSDGSNIQTVGMRFNGVTIPNGATITNATIQFQVDEVNTGSTSLSIQGENVVNASTFVGSSGNITSRPLTTASVLWSPVPWTTKGEAGPDQQTPDIKSVIQEIVNLPGWASGNSLAVIIKGTGERTAESFNGDSSAAARLHLEFITGAPVGLPVNVPDLVGSTEAIATTAITGAGLTLGTVTSESSASPVGEVISQNPVAGASVAAGSTVDIVVSSGLTTGPVSLDIQVAASSDDAEERASGAMSLNSSDLELTSDGSNIQTVGMRFNGVTIPAGATITNATIQFQADELNSGATSLTIKGEKSENAFTFIKANGNITDRSLTTASVLWSPVPWTEVGRAGPDQQTPDIKSVIQEIVNLPGWASGNSLAVIIKGTGERTAESFDGVSSAAPKLHVEFSTGQAQLTIPNVVGLTQADATSAITGLGLVLGSVTTQNSASVPAGDVVSQNPVGGTSVASGSAVNIVVSSGPSSSSSNVIFEDNLIGASGTQLDAHVPDSVGTGWTALNTTGSKIVLTGDGTAASTGDKNGAGVLYSANPAPSVADVDIILDMDEVDHSSDDATVLVFRYQDASNFYALWITSNSTEKMKLYKVVSGTPTLLGTSANRPGKYFVSFKIEARGNSLKMYEDPDQKGEWDLVIDVTDSAISAAGKVGYGLGNVIIPGDDIRANIIFNKITVKQFSP